jgi:hypothetical protein
MKRNNTNSAQYWRKSVLTRKKEMVAITKIPKATHTPKKRNELLQRLDGQRGFTREELGGGGVFHTRKKNVKKKIGERGLVT